MGCVSTRKNKRHVFVTKCVGQGRKAELLIPPTRLGMATSKIVVLTDQLLLNKSGGGPFVWGCPRKIRKIWIFRKILFFLYFLEKIAENPPGVQNSMRGFVLDQYEPNPSKLTDFIICFHFFFRKFKKKWPKNETFFNFFPTPQPPGTLKPFPRAKARDGGVVGQIFIPIGPNGASFMPI